ncbi:Alpha/Beta hydrolase protein [Pterulicium gracile]|uniref:Alpha/Beta hydrolase protein n=1 Tax=Pterulicium gracile TaxID=1884261 RepID=A0A5C3QBL4_9AGAR|nr:Alpha/Beta hydrolase protein [Pterula gracilis]
MLLLTRLQASKSDSNPGSSGALLMHKKPLVDLPELFSQSSPAVTPFNWTSVEATTDLQWQDCYTPPLQCSRFSVPFNYSAPDQGNAAIAVIRVPSPLADTDAYKGPLFFNPGGPGGSGIAEWLGGTGAILSATVGEEFDFVTFDPRGVNNSTPALGLLKSTQDSAALIGELDSLLDLQPDASDTLAERLETLRAYGAQIDEYFGATNIHSTTDNVARDMLGMVEAHGREKIQYWGISYGSILGATFAAMFPDKVERLVIDGVMNAHAYYNSDWAENIASGDAALESFFRHCAAAGPELCAFHHTTAEAIHERYDALYEPVKARQVMLSDGKPLIPLVFEATIHNMLYWPHLFSAIGELLATFEQGVTAMFEAPPPSGDLTQSSGSLGPMIRCLDALPVTDSAEELTEWTEGVRAVTKYFPGAVEGAKMFCAGWQTNPEGSFRGPIEGETSHPMLLIGNQYDVVSPLSAAKNVSASFPGSVVLTLNVTGHTTLSRASECVNRHLREYLVNGNLPNADTVCQADVPNLFLPSSPLDSANGTDGGAGEDSGAVGLGAGTWGALVGALVMGLGAVVLD